MPLNLIEHTCAYARWAHMRRFLSVCMLVTPPNFRLENNSYLKRYTSHLPVTPMMVYGTGRWAHINVKLLHFSLLRRIQTGLFFWEKNHFWQIYSNLTLEMGFGVIFDPREMKRVIIFQSVKTHCPCYRNDAFKDWQNPKVWPSYSRILA